MALSDGFAIYGSSTNAKLGYGGSVSSADVNGDGFSDLIVGDSRATANGLGTAGQTYVIYGGANITGLAGTTGVVVGTSAGESLTGTTAAETLVGVRG